MNKTVPRFVAALGLVLLAAMKAQGLTVSAVAPGVSLMPCCSAPPTKKRPDYPLDETGD
jgi:hypothetical protein